MNNKKAVPCPKCGRLPARHAGKKLAYSVPEAARLMSIGKTTLYRLLREGKLVRTSESGLITHDEMTRYLTAEVARSRRELNQATRPN